MKAVLEPDEPAALTDDDKRLRDWVQVAEEYSRRNPDDPIGRHAAAKAHDRAVAKLRTILVSEARRLGVVGWSDRGLA